MKALKIRPVVRRKFLFHCQICATRTTRYYDDFFVISKTNLSLLENRLVWARLKLNLVRLCILPFGN